MTQQNSLLSDIGLRLTHQELRPVYTVDTVKRRVPNKPGAFEDLATVSGRDNLGQAVIMRLLTPRGELEAVGHAEYGSRLHEMIGLENTATNRNLIKLHILESLKQEPRIEETRVVSVTPHQFRRDLVQVRLEVKPAGSVDTLVIGPFTLEL
jgi:phage baseplate assembly protein W